MKHYLIIDIGTGNSRVALTNQLGDLIDIESFENTYWDDEIQGDALSFTPHYWLSIIKEKIEIIKNRHPNMTIDAMTSSGARQSFVLLDSNHQAIYGLPNIDNRAKGLMKDFNKISIYHKTGKWMTEDFGAAKLYAFKKQHPEIFSKATGFTSISEWIALELTGHYCIEHSQACETNLYNLQSKSWDNELFNLFQLKSLIPPKIVKAGAILDGGDIPFVVGGADTQLATYNHQQNENSITIISGTTSPIVAITKDLFLDPNEAGWTSAFLKGDAFMVETNPGVSGLNYQRMRTLLFDDLSYEEIEHALSMVTQIRCTASFSSLNCSKSTSFKLGGFLMKPPLHQDLHRVDLAWALVADIACSIHNQFEALSKKLNMNPDLVYGCGGGFQSKTLSQHLANLIKKPIVLPYNYQQASILGCVHLCNQSFNIHSSFSEDSQTIMPDENDQLINQYRLLWYKRRQLINQKEDFSC